MWEERESRVHLLASKFQEHAEAKDHRAKARGSLSQRSSSPYCTFFFLLLSNLYFTICLAEHLVNFSNLITK